MNKTVLKILAELNYPPIFMIDPKQFEHIEGVSLKGCAGISSDKYTVFAIIKGLRGKEKENTVFHECLHILFPHRPHWWIECTAEKLAGGGGRGYWSKKYRHTPDELPTRSHLLKLARRAGKRLKEKTLIKI